jgi:hypothetical protein
LIARKALRTMPSSSALIGHTGFVGSNLARQQAFDCCFNSQNISEMRGKAFDLVVCAGVSAAKWVANRAPAEDLRGIEKLTDVLQQVKARELILISTIDVYPDPEQGGDELTTIGPHRDPYGRNRYRLEQWAVRRFDCCRVVRLPAVFGVGLKKNVIFDLMHGNQLDRINPAARFQWYPIDRLWQDIATLRSAGLGLANLFPEPMATGRILDACFPSAQVGAPLEPAPSYRVRTRYAQTFGGHEGFIMPAQLCLEQIIDYVAAERLKSKQ